MGARNIFFLRFLASGTKSAREISPGCNNRYCVLLCATTPETECQIAFHRDSNQAEAGRRAWQTQQGTRLHKSTYPAIKNAHLSSKFVNSLIVDKSGFTDRKSVV